MATKSKEQVLTRTFMLTDEGGTMHIFRPGDVPPDWAKEQIQWPGAFADADLVEVPEVGYDAMSTKELIAKANERGLEIETTNRLDVIEALRLWDAADSNGE